MSLTFKDAHNLVNGDQTLLEPVVGESWWVHLWGNAGTWIWGRGWVLRMFPTGTPCPRWRWWASVTTGSLLESSGELLNTQIPSPHCRPRKCRARYASSALRIESQACSQEAGRAWAVAWSNSSTRWEVMCAIRKRARGRHGHSRQREGPSKSSWRKCLTKMNIINNGSYFVLYCFLIISRILELLPQLVCELFESETGLLKSIFCSLAKFINRCLINKYWTKQILSWKSQFHLIFNPLHVNNMDAVFLMCGPVERSSNN